MAWSHVQGNIRDSVQKGETLFTSFRVDAGAEVFGLRSEVCILKELTPARKKDEETGKMVPDYWPASVKMIGEMGFLQSLQKFDKDSIPPAAPPRLLSF